MFKATGTFNNKEVIVESVDGIDWELQAAPIVGDPANRELKSLFGVSTIQEVMQMIQIRCQTGNFTGLQDYDYVDGLSLNGITAPPSGTAPQAWNDSQKNNRFEISGINTYKNLIKDNQTVNAKNHIIFSFVNCTNTARMRSNWTNSGGYLATELKTWVNNTFTPGLEQRLGIQLYPLWKLHSTKGSSAWAEYKVWPMSEIEVFGSVTLGDEVLNGSNNSSKQLAISNSRIKKLNGSNQWYWTQTPRASDNHDFVNAGGDGGHVSSEDSDIIIAFTSAFCVSYQD